MKENVIVTMLILNFPIPLPPRLNFDGGGGGLSQARYLNKDSSTLQSISDREVKYLTRFGYLPDLANAQVSGDQIHSALRNLQRFAGIDQTGELDDATKLLIVSKRCGVHDVSTGFRNRKKRHTSVQGEMWHSTNISWSLLEQNNSELPRPYVLRELHHALSVWQQGSALSFQFEGNRQDSDIVISFHRGHHGDGYPFDGEGVVLAHAFYPGGGRGGDAHFDLDESWALTSLDVGDRQTSLFSVALHEFGHSLGLAHSSVKGSIMYPWYSNSEPIYDLPWEDKYALSSLYGGDVPQPEDRLKSNKRNEDRSSYSTTHQTSTSRSSSSMTTSVPASFTTTTKNMEPIDARESCGGGFDAVAVLRNEMWMFKGKYFWRKKGNSNMRTEPVEISSFWYRLPRDLEKVDAVYEKKTHEMVFFVGRHLYILAGNSHLIAGPLPLTVLGLPENLDHIDGAMRWGYNEKTYFFSGSEYWAFDDSTGKVELDYPRSISWWSGVPTNIDSVFQFTDKKTYFFKGSKFWEFDDEKKSVVNLTGTYIKDQWFQCPPSTLQVSSSTLNYNPQKLTLYALLCFTYISIINRAPM